MGTETRCRRGVEGIWLRLLSPPSASIIRISDILLVGWHVAPAPSFLQAVTLCLCLCLCLCICLCICPSLCLCVRLCATPARCSKVLARELGVPRWRARSAHPTDAVKARGLPFLIAGAFAYDVSRRGKNDLEDVTSDSLVFRHDVCRSCAESWGDHRFS